MNNIYKINTGVWYIKEGPKYGNKDMIKFLFSDAYKNGKNISRCCLHENINSELMIMMIGFVNHKIYPAHRHKWKDESYIIIEGKCEYVEYDEKSMIIFKKVLDVGDVFYNSNKNFHKIIPLSKELGLIECTIGPLQNKPLEYL